VLADALTDIYSDLNCVKKVIHVPFTARFSVAGRLQSIEQGQIPGSPLPNQKS
jgi:hypothetical protein